MNIRRPETDELPSLTQLWLGTGFAVAVAAVLAVAVVLPAERGVDITGIGERLHLTRMGQIKTAMAEPDAPAEGRPRQQREISLTLLDGEGQEVKLDMLKGYTADYSWHTDGGAVYHDTHGDPYANPNIYISYSTAEAAREDSGHITAVYGGHHGWYWVNNGDVPVTITLQASGEFIELLVK